MDHLYSEGVLYIQSCFAGPNVSGALLICGIGGGEGGGGGAGRCGKTSLARLLCKEACDVPYCAYVLVMDCIELRGTYIYIHVHVRVLYQCVLLDILVGHLREMHGKWPVHGHLLFCTLNVVIHTYRCT